MMDLETLLTDGHRDRVAWAFIIKVDSLPTSSVTALVAEGLVGLEDILTDGTTIEAPAG